MDVRFVRDERRDEINMKQIKIAIELVVVCLIELEIA